MGPQITCKVWLFAKKIPVGNGLDRSLQADFTIICGPKTPNSSLLTPNFLFSLCFAAVVR